MEPSPHIIVLMYHRVDKKDTDPWGICVSPDHFTEQIQLIRKRLPVITVEEAVRQVTEKDIPETSVCITFDDGYKDNYTNALPVLKTFGCPATFFIATAFIGKSEPFWWDELEMICLHSKQLSDFLELRIGTVTYRFPFEPALTEEVWQQHLTWKWYEEPPTHRCHSFLAIWNLLCPLSHTDLQKQMNNIRTWANTGFQSRLPMTEMQLREMASEKLITLGLHTHTHPDLASHTEKYQHNDISAANNILRHQYKIESAILAYPYGRYNEATLSVATKQNLAGCFTTKSVPVTADSDVRQLGRNQVFDWDTQEFEKQLTEWHSE